MTADRMFPAAACVQFCIALGDVARNIEQVRRLIVARRPEPNTMVLLPEMWATGFDYARLPELCARRPEILAAMERLAAEHHIFLGGSLAEAGEHGGLPRNMFSLVGPQGLVGSLPKRHLFAHWQEDLHFTPGLELTPLSTPHGLIGGIVCYDLRFPELARRQVFAGCRQLAVCAQWPLVRRDHWRALCQARAIENQAVVVAVNSCGVTGAMELAGHSLIVGPDGTILREAGAEEAIIDCALPLDEVESLRRRFFPAGERPWLGADRDKIKGLAELLAELAQVRRHGSRVAFTNGCFDLLHAGHVSYLEQARRTADCLVVGLNADSSVRALKGPSRPVNAQEDRARVLAALGCVDYVVLFAEETPIRLIEAIHPDVLVKGADWPEERIVGAAEVKAAGGLVARISFEHDRSTTALLEKILQHKTARS